MDVFGQAISDLHKTGTADILWLHNSYGEVEEMPLELFFRNEDEMPFMELKAVELCKGEILDVGAGTGSHTLLLQEIGRDVTAIDTSENAIQIMHDRGVKNTIHNSFFKLKDKQFDTLLFLMNGIGLTGTLPGLNNLLVSAHTLLRPGGRLIFDSSDISYLYEGGIKPIDKYFGEIRYCYEYKGLKGDWFDWLYIDQQTLKDLCLSTGWSCDIVYEDDEDQYLACLTAAIA